MQLEKKVAYKYLKCAYKHTYALIRNSISYIRRPNIGESISN